MMNRIYIQRRYRKVSKMFSSFVFLAVPPKIQPGPRVIKVQVGHQVELACVATGFPKPTLTWTKDGKRYSVSPDGSLKLRKVGLDDEGIFTCTATNTAGRDEARLKVLVQGWF